MNEQKILIVDDCSEIRRLCANALSSEGYDVETCKNGFEALLKFLEKVYYDLVITDIKIPKLDGITLLKHIKANLIDTYVIIITGYGSIEGAIEAIKLGAYDYLTKPFKIDKLKHTVKLCLEKKELDRERQKLSHIITLTELGKRLTGNLDLFSLLQHTIELVMHTFTSDTASIMLLEDDGKHLRIVAHRGLPDEVKTGTLVNIDSGIAGYTIKKNEPLLLIGELENTPFGEFAKRHNIGSAISINLKHYNNIIGVLNVTRKKESVCYNIEDLQFLKIFTDEISLAIQNAKTYQELKDINMQIILALASAVDKKHRYTHEHSVNVCRYAVNIAKAMGFYNSEIDDIRKAGLLHDIGKIGINDAILNKPGQLNEDEWTQMKKHPIIGADILAKVDFLKGIIPGVRHHHERYDGSGYPDGLAGNKIPLEARILSLSDAFEAMTSDRPYRSGMTYSRAKEEIKKFSGEQFDPSLVEVFLGIPEKDLKKSSN